jgi:quercetin dioxygenase-like cupin family protein
MVTAISPKFTATHNSTELHIFHANTGEGLPQHQHQYNHLTMVHAGSIVIRKEGKEVVRTKNEKPVNLLANQWHEIEALEDNTVFVNVFAEGKY